ncbi:MAG: ABC transporter substrate-binding protein [Spirochaetaceae bacterium]|nr:ABC transporter substrate-binding protein [Myxococcales bacterium]MCB9724485.1 ABC transporter substrate-binding protein [Spirochaetaceae bacterium]
MERGDVAGTKGRGRRRTRVLVALVVLATLYAAGCSNDPYPPEAPGEKVLYGAFEEAPRSLDPATAYDTRAHAITGAVYATLLEYHFLKRPLELMPSLAVAMPEERALADGRVVYRFELRRDLLFADDACFELGGAGRRTREILAADVAFQIARLADPKVGSPVVEPFSHIEGFSDFAAALAARRESDAAFAARPVHEQYAAVGGIRGARTPSSHVLEIVLDKPYPQILYWLAMEFSTPVPWEAIAFYDGAEGRPRFDDHPVGAGPFVLSVYDKQARYTLVPNRNWHGLRHPEWQAPGTVYPSEGEPGDREAGLLEDAGRPLPFLDRVEVRRDKESIPRFNKFLQGYYDASGIIKESFDKVMQGDALSPEMQAMGIELGKAVSPDFFYLGFNMDDAVVGRAGGERSRKLRQAMSLVLDTEEFLRVFLNGRGLPAQSPVPPGIYGYEEDYRNPYRQVDLERARALMIEAGYPGGIDPRTGEALKLTFDSYNTSAQGLTQTRFYTHAWQQLGIDVQIDATNYNQFQEKLRNGAYQVFESGWVADYPDPENFLFLVWGEMGQSKSGGPNYANFADPRFDRLFLSMKTRENGPRRLAEIREMKEILARERPWIELFHREDYALYHGWVKNVKPMGLSMPTYQYRDVDVELRARRRHEWNRPVTWPAWVLLGAGIAILVPGIRTWRRERQ